MHKLIWVFLLLPNICLGNTEKLLSRHGTELAELQQEAFAFKLFSHTDTRHRDLAPLLNELKFFIKKWRVALDTEVQNTTVNPKKLKNQVMSFVYLRQLVFDAAQVYPSVITQCPSAQLKGQLNARLEKHGEATWARALQSLLHQAPHGVAKEHWRNFSPTLEPMELYSTEMLLARLELLNSL